MTNHTVPGFTAEAALYPRTAHRGRRGAPSADIAVIPAQLDWVSILNKGYRYRHEPGTSCGPGQVLEFVEGGVTTEYCTAVEVYYDYATHMFRERTYEYPCGWTAVQPHWECRDRRLRVWRG
jgi:hypothetical protein